jgi:hypothetical protein
MPERHDPRHLRLRLSMTLTLLLFLASPPAAATELAVWFDDELTPWLTERLSTHPRFKGEPVRVTVFDGSEEAARPDLLSYGLASRLEERLSRASTVRLAWRPAAPDAGVSALPSTRPDCRPPDERYLIVVDSSRQGQSGAQVRIRALDLDDRSWVARVNRVWQGRLSRDELQQLSGSRPRQEFRGARALPYRADEQDLLAAHAARGIACALLAHPAHRPGMWAEEVDDAGDLAAVPGLVALQLARYGVVTQVATREEADLILTVEAIAVSGGPRQVWVAATPKSAGGELPSASVSIYAQTEGPAGAPAAVPAESTAKALSLHFESAPSGGGLRIRVSGTGLDRMAVLAMRADGSLTRLDAADCGSIAQARAAGLPLPAVGEGHVPVVFAVGAAGEQAGRALVRELIRVPPECTGRRLRGAELRDWLADFGRRLEKYGDRIVWRSARPDPDAPGPALADAG